MLTASAPTVVQPAWQWRHLGRAIPGQTADRLDALAGRPDTWYATGGQVFVWRWMRQHATFTRTAEGSPTFTVTRPWLHPYLATLPMTLRVPTGVTAVVWKGECRPVTQGVVDLAW